MRTQLLLTLAVAGPLTVVMALPAAAAPCDAYSGGCPTSGPHSFPNGGGGVGAGAVTAGGKAGGGVGGGVGAGVAAGAGGALPFTGGEITLYSLIGLGALGAGTALVIAGRRRLQAD